MSKRPREFTSPPKFHYRRWDRKQTRRGPVLSAQVITPPGSTQTPRPKKNTTLRQPKFTQDQTPRYGEAITDATSLPPIPIPDLLAPKRDRRGKVWDTHILSDFKLKMTNRLRMNSSLSGSLWEKSVSMNTWIKRIFPVATPAESAWRKMASSGASAVLDAASSATPVVSRPILLCPFIQLKNRLESFSRRLPCMQRGLYSTLDMGGHAVQQIYPPQPLRARQLEMGEMKN